MKRVSAFTEKEYDYAVKQNKTVLAFIHGDPDSIPVSKVDIDQSISRQTGSIPQESINRPSR